MFFQRHHNAIYEVKPSHKGATNRPAQDSRNKLDYENKTIKRPKSLRWIQRSICEDFWNGQYRTEKIQAALDELMKTGIVGYGWVDEELSYHIRRTSADDYRVLHKGAKSQKRHER